MKKKLNYFYGMMIELFGIIQTLVTLKLLWLIPVSVILIIIALLVALIGGTGPLAPFVYPLL